MWKIKQVFASEETDYELYFDSGHENLFCEPWIPVKKR